MPLGGDVIDALRAALEKMSKSPAFQNKVTAAAKNESKRVGSNAAKISAQNAQVYADKMREIIRRKMDEQHTTGGTELGQVYGDMDVEISTTSDGRLRVELSFSKDSNLSPSLNYDDWGNIVLPRLLNKGWDASGRKMAVGEWHGKTIQGWNQRSPMHFLEDAVAEFNEIYKGQAEAVYSQLVYRDPNEVFSE